MPKKRSRRPSSAWVDEVFKSPPRRNVWAESKSTTRVPVKYPSTTMYGEGGNEATALYLLQHLQRNGLALRVKAQPFFLHELGGPQKRVPDILVELDFDPPLHIIQCKSTRFITAEVQQKFDEEKEFLEQRGFKFHCWTDRDKLSPLTSQSVRLLDRGLLLPITHARLSEIERAAAQATLLGELIEMFGWDDCLAAASNAVFYINVTEKIHEQTPLLPNFPRQKYELLFEHRPVPGGFWNSLTS